MKNPTIVPSMALLCCVLAACAPAESHDAASADDSVIGIGQCDDYLAALDACLRDRVPEDDRTPLVAEAHRMFTTWKEAAGDPQQRATLPQACSITRDVAREELAKYGCAL